MSMTPRTVHRTTQEQYDSMLRISNQPPRRRCRVYALQKYNLPQEADSPGCKLTVLPYAYLQVLTLDFYVLSWKYVPIYKQRCFKPPCENIRRKLHKYFSAIWPLTFLLNCPRDVQDIRRCAVVDCCSVYTAQRISAQP